MLSLHYIQIDIVFAQIANHQILFSLVFSTQTLSWNFKIRVALRLCLLCSLCCCCVLYPYYFLISRGHKLMQTVYIF